jgi:hypothetical protein
MSLDQIFTTGVDSTPLSIYSLALSLLVGAILAFIVRTHFFRYSNALSNRTEFMTVLPFIILTTILIITIVKSSLALSLGLVGALSIVRFRTPIKEPEELAYLFISIAIGLGLGANQLSATIFSTILILLLMTFFMSNKKLNKGVGETYINLSGIIDDDSLKSITKSMFDKLLPLSKRVSLKRYIVNDNHVDLTYYVSELNPDLVDAFISDLKIDFPNTSITMLDQRNLPPL